MGVKEDLVKLKGTVAGWTATEEGYRGFVAAILFVVGWFAVLGPLEKRLKTAREEKEALSALATWVEEIRELESQTATFEGRMVAEANAAEWDSYILAALTDSGATFISSQERKTEKIKDYTLFIREVVAMGDFEQLVDFMDRLERGERYLRIDEFSLRPQQGELALRCTIRCLVGETTAQRRARMGGPEPLDGGA